MKMIKQLPGWANWIALWLVYMFAGFTFYFILGYEVDWRYIVVICALHAGIYLAKWRFNEGNWKFW